ncbi:MAG TPA: hypothetical protein VK427_01560 [Kofleriaceae bacterium]|nr:hypothetical protein [Kofleriaceae bacterium]
MRQSPLSLLSTGLALSLTLALGACRGSDSSGDDAPTPDAAIPPGGSVKIKDVQNDAMPVGTKVEVRGVVVTAIDSFGSRTGDLWVQDPEGGPFSGIKVFRAPIDQVGALTVGDIVDITNAEKDEFALTSDMTGRKVTELKGASGGMMTVTKKSPGTVPAPAVVDAKTIAAMTKTEREAEWEKWEGVLIKVTNARQLADTDTFGSNPGPDSNEFRITGVARVQSALVQLPSTARFAVCYESITGVSDYFFNDLVLPRTEADLVSGGSDCRPMATTITEAQATGTNVELVDVAEAYVSAVSGNRKNMWISSSLTAAPNEGIYVFRGNTMDTTVLPVDVVVGAKVTVKGAVTEHNNDAMGDTVTQISAPTISVLAGPTAPPVPLVGLTAAMLTASATGEPYESVLVTLTGVRVMTVGNSNNFYVGELRQGTTAFLSDDDILRLVGADENGCFTLTGIWTYQVFNNAYGLLPISKTATPSACN